MFNQKNRDTDSNFWISYADLMSGLLFVFILLIGAIISKSSLLKNMISTQDEKLHILLNTLKSQEDYLLKKDKLLIKKNKIINKNKDELIKKELELQHKNANLAKNTLLLSKNEKLIKLKLEEIKKLNKLLFAEKIKSDKLNGKILMIQTQFNTQKDKLVKTRNELKIEKKQIEEINKNLKAYEGRVVILSNKLRDTNNMVKLKDEKLLALLTSMDKRNTKYDNLIARFQKQKEKIKSLTGIKLQVIASLKEALGSKINIDKKTGSLKLASNILFSIGESKLKDTSKVELKKVFEKYIGALIKDESIRPHLDKIIIEGHTDSDGGYIYNLKLSQDRALAVMQYLLTLNFTKQNNIQNLMMASGRAYLDAITNNGIEDKELSRRIEIKFKLKNEAAMQEIEKVLDAK